MFFYFKQKDKLRDSLAGLLKGLLIQLIQQSPEVIPYILDEFSKTVDNKIESVETLSRVTEIVIESTRPTMVILDGLDKCDKKERKHILAWIRRILVQADQSRPLRVFISSQDEEDIRTKRSKGPSSSLDEMVGHRHKISVYV